MDGDCIACAGTVISRKSAVSTHFVSTWLTIFGIILMNDIFFRGVWEWRAGGGMGAGI